MKRGTRFIHKRFLDKHHQPIEGIVTAVRKGRVYWKQDGDKKAFFYFYEKDAENSVMSIVE